MSRVMLDEARDQDAGKSHAEAAPNVPQQHRRDAKTDDRDTDERQQQPSRNQLRRDRCVHRDAQPSVAPCVDELSVLQDQYSTGVVSRLRHMYQVATERQGAHLRAISRI